jgi:death-on-curing protein
MIQAEFPELEMVLKFHYKLIERYGGSHGLRDQGALESALAATQNRYFYEEANLATCAATYAYHLSQAHAFIDGNKRIA